MPIMTCLHINGSPAFPTPYLWPFSESSMSALELKHTDLMNFVGRNPRRGGVSDWMKYGEIETPSSKKEYHR